MEIIIVDDSATFREYLKEFIEDKYNYKVISLFDNGVQLINNSKKLSSEIILMDINMPIIDGINTTKHLLWKRRGLNIIAITSYHTTTFLSDLVCAGFKACIFKDRIYEELDSTIQKVIRGEIYFPEDIVLHPL